MSSMIPPGVVVRKVKEIPPLARLSRGGNGSKYLWLHELAFEMKPVDDKLQITMGSKALALAALASLKKVVGKIGPELDPPRKWDVWVSLAEGSSSAEEPHDLWVECFWVREGEEGSDGGEPADDGDGEGEDTGVDKSSSYEPVTYKSHTGRVYSVGEMKTLLNDKRVVPNEKFLNSKRGMMVVVNQGDKLVLRMAAKKNGNGR